MHRYMRAVIIRTSFNTKNIIKMNKKLIFTLVSALVSTQAFAEAKIQLSPVVVTATKSAVNSFDLPVSIDVVNQSDIQDAQLKMTLSESLIRVPGITAQNRSQFSQDPQISTRGFGSRSAFGVRGLRIYVDGIPFSMPDGIGQPGNIDLGTVKTIEVMRGPFSSLYGNSSGGVIQLLTEDAPKTPEVSTELLTGSYGTNRQNIRVGGTEGNVEYLVNYSNFETDGYRKNSDAKKEQFTAKLKFNFTDSTKLTMLANWMDMSAQDPLGLPRSDTTSGAMFQPSAFSSPKGVPNVALLANTRVSRKNEQVGFNLEHAFDESNSVNFITSIGKRENTQFLSVYSSTGTSAPTNRIDGGRASIIDRDFWSGELRYNHKGLILSRPYSVTAGYSYGEMKDTRSDVTAYGGVVQDSSNLTNVNRDEKNTAKNNDKYVQGQFSVSESLDLHAGVRNTKVNIKVEDGLVDLTKNFAQSFNAKYRDSSGSLSYEKTTPVVGAVWKVNPALNLYANYGKGFETPNLIELAYDNTAGTGPNLGLKPSESDNYEVGFKAFPNDTTKLNVAAFRTNTDKEIVVSQSGAYAVYNNAGKTKREGLEVSVDSQLPNNFGLYGAYTYLDAKFDSSFTSAGNVVNSGNYIPGTYRNQLYGEVSWRAPSVGFYTALEGRYNSKVYVDDRNTDSADSYAIFNVRAGFQQNVSNWRFSEFLRLENITDKEYIGSVRVNDGNSRFYEPAIGRAWMLGVNANYRF
jgi:iron complex outermembrane recepter protein